MKKKWKIALILGGLLIASVAVFAGIKYNQRGIVTVQTGKVARQDWRRSSPLPVRSSRETIST